MEDEAWSFGLSSRYSKSGHKTLNDLCVDFEDIEDEDELRTEYPCPFCSEDFDIGGLCCHIDEEHPDESNPGMCPVCATRVGMNMVAHIMTQHSSIFKSHHRLKLRKGSSLSSFKKEFYDGHFQSLLSRSSSTVSSTKITPGPLFSFLSCLAPPDHSESMKSATSTEMSLEEISSNEQMLEKSVPLSPSSDKDLMEKLKRCEFVQGLLMSTIIDYDL